MEIDKDDGINQSKTVQSPNRQHSIGKLSSSKKAKPRTIETADTIESAASYNLITEDEFTKVLSAKDEQINSLKREAAGLRSDFEELRSTESVELADLRRKYHKLQRSKTLRAKALEEENKILKARLADLLYSEDVRVGDLNAQIYKLHKTIKMSNDNILVPKICDIDVKNKQNSGNCDALEKNRIDDLRSEIKRLQDIMRLHGIDSYPQNPLAVKSTTDNLMTSLTLEKHKTEIEQATEELRTCEISNSESDDSVTKLRKDNNKENETLRKQVIELEEHVKELTDSESVLIGDLQNKIKKRKLNEEKLEKEVVRLEVEVQERAMRVKELEKEKSSIYSSLTANSSNDSSENVIEQKLSFGPFAMHNDFIDSDTTQRNQIGMILNCPRENDPTSKESLPSKTVSLHESISENDLSSTTHRRPPLGSLKLSQSDVKKSLDKEVIKKISQLTKETNKWRIKATLLVEKKNYARILEKENIELKLMIEKLRADLEKACVRPHRIPSSPKARANLSRKGQSPDRYII